MRDAPFSFRVKLALAFERKEEETPSVCQSKLVCSTFLTKATSKFPAFLLLQGEDIQA